jgi:hypothetical protein
LLERFNSTESRQLLLALSKGMKHADETIEAQRSLERLVHRAAAP